MKIANNLINVVTKFTTCSNNYELSILLHIQWMEAGSRRRDCFELVKVKESISECNPSVGNDIFGKKTEKPSKLGQEINSVKKLRRHVPFSYGGYSYASTLILR